MSLDWLERLEQPVISAPMAGASGGRLAAAVTAAGGLGMIGLGSAVTPQSVEQQCQLVRGGAFGVGLMLWALEERPEVLEAALEAQPVLVSLSFGDPAPFVPSVQASGASACTQVGTLAEAHRALDAGVDLLVARGSEGGGHGRAEVATLPLLQQVLEISDVPVVAAGGIGTARGVAAVLAAGAVAAWVGTPFAACLESEAADSVKQAIIDSDAADTVYTRAFDIAQRFGWPSVYGGRALSNQFTDQWAERLRELEERVRSTEEITTAMNAARAAGDIRTAPVYAGQSAGLVHALRSAEQVVAELSGFRSHLAEVCRSWV